MIKRFVKDVVEWSLATAWWNLRFDLGYAIGGFDHAQRFGDDTPDGAIVGTGMPS